MKEYFYTNAQLALILKTNAQGHIDWENNGFSVKDVVRYQFFKMTDKGMEVLLPISDKQKFNLALGNLIVLGVDEDEFYKVITEEQALNKKLEFKVIQEQSTTTQK